MGKIVRFVKTNQPRLTAHIVPEDGDLPEALRIDYGEIELSNHEYTAYQDREAQDMCQHPHFGISGLITGSSDFGDRPLRNYCCPNCHTFRLYRGITDNMKEPPERMDTGEPFLEEQKQDTLYEILQRRHEMHLSQDGKYLWKHGEWYDITNTKKDDGGEMTYIIKRRSLDITDREYYFGEIETTYADEIQIKNRGVISVKSARGLKPGMIVEIYGKGSGWTVRGIRVAGGRWIRKYRQKTKSERLCAGEDYCPICTGEFVIKKRGNSG